MQHNVSRRGGTVMEDTLNSKQNIESLDRLPELDETLN